MKKIFDIDLVSKQKILRTIKIIKHDERGEIKMPM